MAQSLKYVLSGPLMNKFVDPLSIVTLFKLSVTAEISHLCSDQRSGQEPLVTT